MASPTPSPESLSTWQQILAALAPFIGTGGLGAIAIAWLGYRQKKSEPKEEPEKQGAMLAVAAAYADREVWEKLIEVGSGLIVALEKVSDTIAAKSNMVQDEMRDLRHTIDDAMRVIRAKNDR